MPPVVLDMIFVSFTGIDWILIRSNSTWHIRFSCAGLQSGSRYSHRSGCFLYTLEIESLHNNTFRYSLSLVYFIFQKLRGISPVAHSFNSFIPINLNSWFDVCQGNIQNASLTLDANLEDDQSEGDNDQELSSKSTL